MNSQNNKGVSLSGNNRIQDEVNTSTVLNQLSLESILSDGFPVSTGTAGKNGVENSSD